MNWKQLQVANKIALAAVSVTALGVLCTGVGATAGWVNAIHPWGLGAPKPGRITQVSNTYVSVGANVPVPAAGKSGESDTCGSPLLGASPIAGTGSVVVLDAKLEGDVGCWQDQETIAHAPSDVRFLLAYKNAGKTVQNHIIVRVNPAPSMHLIPNTTRVYTSLHAAGRLDTSENLADGGLDIGNFGSGAIAFVTFDLSITSLGGFSCGRTDLSVVGVAHPQAENEYYNIAKLSLAKTC